MAGDWNSFDWREHIDEKPACGTVWRRDDGYGGLTVVIIDYDAIDERFVVVRDVQTDETSREPWPMMVTGCIGWRFVAAASA